MENVDLHIIKGPPVAKVSRTAAESKLKAMPEIKQASSYQLREVEGIWVAAVAVPKTAVTKESAPPPFAAPEEAPDDAPEGPPADAADEAPETPDDSDGDKPKDEGKGEKKGLEHQVEQLTHMLGTLMEALGLGPAGPEDPMGQEGEPGPPPPGPEGMRGPDNKTHTVHERALKPGEAPPGTTPVGSPTFASVNPDHPWRELIGKKKTFTLEEPIGDRTMASVNAELAEIAKGTGYAVKRAKEGINNGVRVARVLVQAEN